MINIPEENQLVDIKNQITLADSEVKRLRDLKRSIQLQIDQLVKDKRWHEDEVVRLSGIETDKQSVIATLDQQLAEKQHTLKSANETIENALVVRSQHAQASHEIEVANNKLQTDTQDAHNKLTDRENIIKQGEDALQTHQAEHRANEAALNVKTAKLAQVINEIRQ